MQFYSIAFLFCFLPVFIMIYAWCSARGKTALLVFGSLFFYAMACKGAYWQVVALAGGCVLTYCLGLLLQKRGRGWLLGLSVAALIGSLVFCKFFDGGRWLLPGMSFLALQMSAYLIDVYRQKLPAEQDLLRYSAGIVMFPKLLSGPLAAPAQLYSPENGRATKALFHRGLQELIWGLVMKVLLANRFGGLWSQGKVIGYDGMSTPFAWMALCAYALQLYFDFYGYSLMAVGLGHMLGLRLPQNFDSPYASKSVSEFYRRWHITLGAWFRDYLYIPLGGSRKGMVRTVLNICIVWLATGLWHGTSQGYFLWAGILGILIVNEKLWLGRLLDKSRVLCRIYTVLAVLLSWVPFAVSDPNHLRQFSLCLFGQAGRSGWTDFLIWGESYVGLFVVGIFLATPFPAKLWKKVRSHWTADVLLFVLFWIVVYSISTARQDLFLYFQF